MAILQLPSRRGHVPAGGTTGQIITKLSADNWDYNWGSLSLSATSMNTGKLLGRTTAGAGPFEEIAIGANLTLSGGVLSATGGGGGGAPTDATYLTTTANATLTNEANLGALTTGLLKITVGAGVATPSTAVAGTDYLSGNQTITLSGDVTGSGATAIASTIANSAVTYAKIQNVSVTSRFLGRITAGAGVIEELTAANAKTILSLTSSDVGLGNVTNDAQTKAAVVPNTAPTDGQLLIGKTASNAYVQQSVSGDATLTTNGVLTIANNAVTLAKIQNAAANSKLLGSGATGIGAAYSEITLGTNLSMTGTTLNASGGGTPGGVNTQVQYNNSGAFGGITNATTDGTTMTLTSPKIVTNIKDTNANTLLGITATTSAVNNVTLANAATASGPTIGSTGSDTDIDINVAPKGSGNLVLTSNPVTSSRTQLSLVNTNGTTKSSEVLFKASSTTLWAIGNDIGVNGGQDLYFYDAVGTATVLKLANAVVATNSGTVIGWSSGGGANLSAQDTGLARNAAGVVEINNGTVGTFKDLKCDHVNAVTGYRVNGVAPSGYDLVGNGTDFISYPADLYSSSTAAVSAGYASDTYLAGSTVTVNAGDWKAKGQYHCVFDMTKTAAGTATPIITLRMGTLGTTGDAAICTFTFAAGTAAADTGIFEVWATFRTVGAGTSAVVQGVIKCAHHLAATGLTSTGAAGIGIILNTSSGFNSTTQTKIGLSFNGGASFSGTNTFVQAALTQP